MKALWIGVLLIGLTLAIPAAAAVPGPALSAQATTVTATYTLYGNATSGWGFTPGTISNPGPTLTLSVGESVTLRLFSDDAPTAHNWFIALDGGDAPTAGEPSSQNFSSATTPAVYTFQVPNNVGTFTYRCRFHPTLMTGQVVIVPAPTFVLYGNATQGWGLTATSISNPGPTLTVSQGQTVELALYSQDNVTHEFFVSYSGGATPKTGDPQSPKFSSSLVPVFYSFTASQAGNFSYYCLYHPTIMKGTFQVTSSGGSGPSAPPDYTLYAAVIIIIVIVAIVAMVAIRRRPKTPPEQPPQQG